MYSILFCLEKERFKLKRKDFKDTKNLKSFIENTINHDYGFQSNKYWILKDNDLWLMINTKNKKVTDYFKLKMPIFKPSNNSILNKKFDKYNNFGYASIISFVWQQLNNYNELPDTKPNDIKDFINSFTPSFLNKLSENNMLLIELFDYGFYDSDNNTFSVNNLDEFDGIELIEMLPELANVNCVLTKNIVDNVFFSNAKLTTEPLFITRVQGAQTNYKSINNYNGWVSALMGLGINNGFVNYQELNIDNNSAEIFLLPKNTLYFENNLLDQGEIIIRTETLRNC